MGPGLGGGLHSDDHDATFRCAVALLVLGIPKVALFLPAAFRQREFELRTIPTPAFFFAATDFIDDPWLQHGKTSAYAYGLQHRGLAVKPQVQIRIELCCYRCLGALSTQVAYRLKSG